MNLIWRVGYPLTFAGWRTAGRSRKPVKEEGKKLRCSLHSVRAPPSCSAFSLALSLSFPAQLNGNRKKQKAKQKFRFSFKLTPLHSAQHLTHSLCGLHQRAVLLIALRLWIHTYTCLLWISVGSNAAVEQLVEYTQWKPPLYLSPVMNSLPGFSGARISGCWTLRSDGR